jgi:meso-butanediol dehydrogenase/(S,S)-butanediol dehydrogenase/diacetyl reductase
MSSTKIAIITGAGSGIGKAIAIRLSADGFNLVVNDLPSQEAAVKALIVEIESKGSKAVSYLADISVEEHVAKMIDLAVLTFGALDVVRTGHLPGVAQFTNRAEDGSQRRHQCHEVHS